MATGKTFVATLVVAGKTGHELLRIWTCWVRCLSHKLHGISAAQCGCDASVVQDFNVAVLSTAVAETKISGVFGRASLHGNEAVVLCGLTFELSGRHRHGTWPARRRW